MLLPNITSAILNKVLEWATHHKEDCAKPKEDDKNYNKNSNLSPWDKEFFKIDPGTLVELLLAANYLNIKELIDTMYKTIANILRHKSAEEIRQTFNIKSDFTPEDEERIHREFLWCKNIVK